MQHIDYSFFRYAWNTGHSILKNLLSVEGMIKVLIVMVFFQKSSCGFEILPETITDEGLQFLHFFKSVQIKL
jgi:hypothetical protein